MILSTYSLFISGAEFSPTIAEQKLNLVFHDKAERGDQAPGGRIRGYGYGILRYDITKEFRVADFVNTIWPVVQKIQGQGVSVEIMLDIFHDSQCNFEYSSDALIALASLKLPMSISCYRDDARVQAIMQT